MSDPNIFPPPNPKALISPKGRPNEWVEGLTDNEYHSDKTSVSASSLKKTMVSLKTFFHTFFISDGVEPTKEMKFGKLAHLAILEGAKFKERYVVMPEFVGPTLKGDMSPNSKAAKEKRAAWIADQPPGAIITTMEEREHLLGMMDSLLSHAKASDFLKVGIAEVSGFYTDPETGISCKIRPDFMCRERRIITEFKTTEDCREESFQWQIFGERYPMHYDLQLAMQCEGFKQIEGKPVAIAAWIAIEKKPPYEVAVHLMTVPVQDIGLIKYRRAMTALKYGIDHDEWPGVQAPNDVSFIVPPDNMLQKYGVNYEGELV